MNTLLKMLAAGAVLLPLAGCGETDKIPYANTIKVENPNATPEEITELAAHVVPTPQQLEALEDGYIAFVHFGPNTFTRREWGTGMEDPKVFDIKTLDTDQWAKTLKDAGMKKVILTVKHHDGFVIFNSRYTDHGIMATPFEEGQGDVLRELSKSCEKYGLKLGVYLSPADLYQIENPEGLYGNLSQKTKRTIPRPVEGRPFKNDSTKFEFVVDDYNEYFLNQLFELLTEYGPIHEVWFDGAHPKRKGGQTYDYASWKELIHTLAPDAVVFGREDIRWGGNEAGATREEEWNVVGYDGNPDTATVFHDMTDADLGSIDALSQKTFLHYQPAEIDTSIREGWFYRDDDKQRSRSADDVFDIYERSIGGNSIFILNVPPNREGRFSQQDVDVLLEAGRRINDTYSTDLLAGSKASAELLDDDIHSYVKASKPIEIKLPQAVTINRFLIQEPVADRGERIEDATLEAMIDGSWQEIATTKNVGFKRIMRFPDVTTDRLRLRVNRSRLEPYVAKVSAHYYKAHAPRLTSTRAADGMVTIEPAMVEFGWNRSADNSASNLSTGTEIYYTTDGSTPTTSSTLYTGPFEMADGTLKAVAVLHGEEGPVYDARYGHIKKAWKTVVSSKAVEGHEAEMAFDANPRTFWSTPKSAQPSLAIDLGGSYPVNGIIYTPQTSSPDGMISKGSIEVSADGKSWKKVGVFEFGNLVNDPTPREYFLTTPAEGRYIRITPLETTGPVASIAELDIF